MASPGAPTVRNHRGASDRDGSVDLATRGRRMATEASTESRAEAAADFFDWEREIEAAPRRSTAPAGSGAARKRGSGRTSVGSNGDGAATAPGPAPGRRAASRLPATTGAAHDQRALTRGRTTKTERRRRLAIVLGVILALAVGAIAAVVTASSAQSQAAPLQALSHPVTMAVSHHSITVDGHERSWREEVPAGVDGPLPLVIVLHGAGLDGDRMAAGSDFSQHAARMGFALAFPDGLYTGWDAGGCCTPADVDHMADSEFLAQMQADLESRNVTSSGNVYAVGFSNGGMMALTAACAKDSPIRAVAVVAAALVAPCPRSSPVSVLMMHGTADGMVPIAGYEGTVPATGKPLVYPPLGETLAQFAQKGNCSPVPSRERFADAIVDLRFSGCTKGFEVHALLFQDAAHNWPDGKRPVGPNGFVRFDASEEILKSFGLLPTT